MTCSERHELFELYSLGALEQEDQLEIEDHLAKGCDTCRRGLKEAVAMNAMAIVAQRMRSIRLSIFMGVGESGFRWESQL